MLTNETIYFDMDGTIVDFYGYPGWLDLLVMKDATPYELAKPLVNLSTFARMVNRLQKEGFRIGIISWLSKTSDADFDEEVTRAKKTWLAKHLKSVEWDEIKIVPYGTPKHEVVDNIGWLFDDEKPNRDAWGNAYSFDASEMMTILKAFQGISTLNQLGVWKELNETIF